LDFEHCDRTAQPPNIKDACVSAVRGKQDLIRKVGMRLVPIYPREWLLSQVFNLCARRIRSIKVGVLIAVAICEKEDVLGVFRPPESVYSPTFVVRDLPDSPSSDRPQEHVENSARVGRQVGELGPVLRDRWLGVLRIAKEEMGGDKAGWRRHLPQFLQTP
jgi:hypothetical protein